MRPLVLAAIALATLTACPVTDTDCTTLAAVSVTVNVVDDAGAPIDGATVTWSSETQSDQPCDAMTDGTYLCGYEVEGLIDISVSHPDFISWTDSVEVSADECHVIGETLEASLVPTVDDCFGVSLSRSLQVTVLGVGWSEYDVEDATVTYVVDGAGDETTCDTEPGNVHWCGWEEIGTFNYTVTAPGHSTETGTVEVELTEDGCHADTEEIEVTLECEIC